MGERERHRRLFELFEEVSRLDDAERPVFLANCAREDASIAEELEQLLLADGSESEFLDTMAERGLMAVVGDEEGLIGETVGPYCIDGYIASGGMGSVYRARREDPPQIVAIKVLKAGILDRRTLRRFEGEAALLASLDHPGIARIIDLGEIGKAPNSRPCFVMDYIEGACPITSYAEREGLSDEQRIRLFLQTCDAVQHGHQRGVIHRDLKPDNVLVDHEGRCRVIDFGVARVTDVDVATTSLATRSGQIIGTPAYMSPEQVRGAVADIDTRSDVFALGILLFELLGTESPLELRGKPLHEASRMICEDEPKRLGSLRGRFRGDIEVICGKAMDKRRDERYASAGELAADIRRYLAHEPILARPPSALYQLQKFAGRHKGLVAGATLAVLALVVGTVFSTREALRANRAFDHAQNETYKASIAAAVSALDSHDVALARRHLQGAPPALRRWEWTHLNSRLDHSLWQLDLGDVERLGDITFLGPEKLLIDTGSASLDIDLEAKKSRGAAARLVSSSDGRFVARVNEGQIEFFDRQLDEEKRLLALRPFPVAEPVIAIALSPDGGLLALAGQSRVVIVNRDDASDLRKIKVDRRGGGVATMAFTPRGVLIVASALTGRPAWIAPREDELRPLPELDSWVRSVAICPQGRWVALGLQNTNLRQLELPTLELTEVEGRGHLHRGHRSLLLS